MSALQALEKVFISKFCFISDNKNLMLWAEARSKFNIILYGKGTVPLDFSVFLQTWEL
jgi:hypothetical protein